MRTFLQRLQIRVPLVALLVIAWFVLTNHCALGLMPPTTTAACESGQCHGRKSQPKDAPGEACECCRPVHVVPLTGKAAVKFDATKFEIQAFAQVELFNVETTNPAADKFVFDHGPPRCVSFAESVLQRSLPSHAPPIAS